MSLLVIILSIIIFIKSVSYGFYEYKTNNKSGGIIVLFIATLGLILPNLIIYFNGI